MKSIISLNLISKHLSQHYFLIHHLLYRHVLFLYSKRSFTGFIPVLCRKLIFNFLVRFIVFLHIFVRILALFNAKNRGTRPGFSYLLYSIFYVAFTSSHYKSHPRFQSRFVLAARSSRRGLCPPMW